MTDPIAERMKADIVRTQVILRALRDQIKPVPKQEKKP